jgi:hypothetical protein
MKKAKIALLAIAVFAVVGGAYALKARSEHGLYFTTEEGGACSSYRTGVTLVGTGTPSPVLVTNVKNAACVLQATFISD